MIAQPLYRTFSIAPLLLLILSPALAQQGMGGMTASEFRLSDSATYHGRILTHVKYLASEELAGRRPGTPGNLAAATYIAEQLRSTGRILPIEPKGGSGAEAYFHRFEYASGFTLGKNNQVALVTPRTRERLRLGTDYNPMSFSGQAVKKGELVFVGYGITAPTRGYDDYAGVDVTGKIVVVIRHSPDGNSTHSDFAQHMAFATKMRNARDHGAAGVIFINAPKDSAALIPMYFDRSFTRSEIPAIFALSTLFDGVRDPAGRSLREIQLAIDSSKKGAAFVMEGYGAEITTDVAITRHQVPNVVGILPGRDPGLKDQIIVIGAHFDHLGDGGEGSLHRGSEPAIHYGADDNASGVAGMLALAHDLAQSDLRRTVVFVAFNAEEEGLLGSAQLVKNFPLPVANIVTMINMDMIGRLDSNRLQVHGIGTSPRWDSLFTRLMRHPDHSHFSLKRIPDGFGPSDHSSFYAKDIPVLFFFTGQHKDYHRPSDTWEKINYGGEVTIMRLVADVVQQIDARIEPPPFTKVVVQASRTTGGFKVYVGTVPDYGFEGTGLRLSGVSEGGPAQKAGLKEGDVIVRMGAKRIDNVYDYTAVLGELTPKQEVETEFLRDGKKMTVVIVMGSR